MRYSKQYIISILFLMGNTSYGDNLKNILSNTKNKIFDYEFRENSAKSDKLKNSWINPIDLQYTKNYSRQLKNETTKTGSFSIGINQPIFKFGGIYYGIRYAKALKKLNKTQIQLKKREMIVDAIKLLIQIKKSKLEYTKSVLLIKNDRIGIKQKSEQYHAGLLDSSFLDQAILNKNKNENILLELESNIANLEQEFALLSDKNPNALSVPKLKIISMNDYKSKNLELIINRLKVKEKAYDVKMNWTKYLPTVSLQARYSDEDINPLYVNAGIKEKYYSYGFNISMPLDINMFSDVEEKKVAYLKSQVELIEQEKTINQEYTLLVNKLHIINKKIALANKDEKLYKRLYKVTKNLVYAGEKTSSDLHLMSNTLKIRKLDQKIYELDKQLGLLALYAKISE